MAVVYYICLAGHSIFSAIAMPISVEMAIWARRDPVWTSKDKFGTLRHLNRGIPSLQSVILGFRRIEALKLFHKHLGSMVNEWSDETTVNYACGSKGIGGERGWSVVDMQTLEPTGTSFLTGCNKRNLTAIA